MQARSAKDELAVLFYYRVNRVKQRRKDLNGLLFPEMAENPWRTSQGRVLHDWGSAEADGALTALELCAGAGGEALGLEQAGVGHAGLVENGQECLGNLRSDLSNWNAERLDLGASEKGLASSLGYET